MKARERPACGISIPSLYLSKCQLGTTFQSPKLTGLILELGMGHWLVPVSTQRLKDVFHPVPY